VSPLPAADAPVGRVVVPALLAALLLPAAARADWDVSAVTQEAGPPPGLAAEALLEGIATVKSARS